jgi:hypothetical protein
MAESSQLPPPAHERPQLGDLSPVAPFNGASVRAFDHAILERVFHRYSRILGAAFTPRFAPRLALSANCSETNSDRNMSRREMTRWASFGPPDRSKVGNLALASGRI